MPNGLTLWNLNFVVLRLACLLLTFQTIGLVPSLIESSSSATAAQVGSSTQATWLPPVHVAPQRRPSENGSPTQASPNELYPGVFDPDQSPQQPASGRFADQTVSPRGFVPNSQGRSEPPSRTRSGSATSGQGRTGKMISRRPATGQRSSAPAGNRPVSYQQPTEQSMFQESTAEAVASDREVQRAFVAETGPEAVPPEPLPELVATPPREFRGSFTRAPRAAQPAPPDPASPLNAQFAELEQPLNGFAQTPGERPAANGRSAEDPGTQLPDSSVLDAPQPLPAGQTSLGNRSVPARGANMNGSPGSESPGEFAPRRMLSADSKTAPDSFEAAGENEAWQDFDALPRPQKTMSCDQLRGKLLSEPLTEIALDVSPPLPERGELPRLPAGDWVDHNGQLLARGQMVALSRGYVIVDTAEGRRKISVARLGDSSLALVASAWQVPGECAIGAGEYAGRCWTPQLSTWYASNLCHKPLYFEQVQLERYGHSAGPIMGPIRSSAHFFGSVALWPYHTAIHPVNECIYPLGYFRPGNCAPWLVEPFPISGPGALRQGAAITGAAFLF